MSGEEFLKFNNGQKFSFTNFKEIKEEDLKNADAETKRLFNIFAGDDHILQASEAQSLWNRIQTAAATNKKGDNSVFDNDEMQKFLNKDKDIKATKTKFSIDALTSMILQVFAVSGIKPTQQPALVQKSLTEDDLVQYTPEEIENISVQTLSDDVSNARRLYDAQNNEQGSVSKFVNATKETFDTEFASSRVGRYIRKEELCVDLLERSKSEEGLSQKEYLEAKIDFIIEMIQNLEQYSLRTEITNDAINISLKTLTFGIYGDKKTKNSQELDVQKAELEHLKSILARLKPEEINLIISQLLSVDENPKTPSAYNLSFGGKTNIAKPQTITRVGKDNPAYVFSPLEYEVEKGEGSLASLSQAEAYKKMSFEETFQKERGVEYNSEAIMDYTQKDSYMQFLLGIHNRREQLYDMLKEARFIKTTRDLGSEQMPGEIQNNARILMTKLNAALKTVYGNDAAKIQQFIDSIYPNIDNTHFASINKKPEVITNEQGEFVRLSFGVEGETITLPSKNGEESVNLPNLNMKLDDLTINSMISIADKLQSNINTTYEKALNGKTIEEYEEEVKQAYTKVYGSGDSQAIANAYIQSQQEGVGYVKTGISTIGMAVMVAGQLIPVGGQVAAAMTFGGLATATLGSSAVTATELLTKEGKVTKEEWQELAKEVATSIALTATGMKIGKISEGVYLAVAKHCPKLVALASEIGTDATMSLIADLAITGQIDLSGEGIAQLQGVLVGILHAKGNFKTYLDTHAGDTSVKTNSNNRTSSRFSYEVSRNINRGKRAVQYVEDKVVGTYKGTKKAVKGISKTIDFVLLDSKLKNLGIKEKWHRDSVIDFLKNTPIESDEIYEGLLQSIGKMKELQVRDNDIQSVLYYISNSNKQFDQSSLDIINELSNLHQKAKENWDDRTVVHLLFSGRDNAEKLEYLREFSATLDAGYKFDDVEYLIKTGIKGEDGRNAYKEILNSEFVQRTKGGLGAEYTAREYFKVCCDEDGKFNPEYWNILQNMDKVGINQPEKLLEVLKNKDPEITKANIEVFMAKFEQNPTQFNNYNSASLVQKCITREGKLDFSRLEDAQIVNKLGIDSKYLQNKDGSYNQDAINIVTSLKENGFKNEDLHNILLAAQKTPKTIDDGAIYSRDIIQKAIELKNAGVATKNIGNMLNDCIEDGKLNVELLENITPICKMLDTYTITETEWLIPMLQLRNGETQKQTVIQIQKLMQNGFGIYDIQKCEIFDFKNNIGTITPDNIVDAAIQLKQAGFDWNIKNILTKSRYDDGSLNTESLNLIIDLKNKGISESYVDNVLEIVTTEKGELLKNNVDTVLSLLKEYKNSEFCNASKETKQDNDWGAFTLSTNKIASDYISENGNNVSLVNILIKMSSDEAGNINIEALNANKSKLAGLYNKLEAEDKDSFIFYLRRAANKQGTFDENIFNKINELKYLDDGWSDPNYHKTICNFLDACKDENGNLDIQKYDDAIMLVKKHKMSKHEASCTIDLYEELKPYKDKNFVYDLSITEKRQLQSLLLYHSNNLEQLTKVRNILKADIIPTIDTGYSTLMKQLSQSLGDINYVLDKAELDNLHNNMTNLALVLHNNKPIGEVSVDVTYQDLLKRIKSKMSGLSESEKRKIYDYFGFTVKNGEIAGFPSYLGKNIDASDITDSFTRKVVQAVTSELENVYKNNTITVKDNPELSQILTSISKSVPEVYNKFSSPENSVSTLKSLKAMTEAPSFAKLSDNEKQVLILSALLKDSNVGTIKETAFNIYNLASKFNMTNKDRGNLYRLLTMPELIAEYKNTKVGEKGSFNNRWGSPTVEYDKKEVALDMLAFGMKDHNLDELSYLLYSTGENKLISPELQTEIKQRIYEIKSDDFILPQTHTQSIREHAKTQTINGHEVLLVNVQDIPGFYAYVHTPDAGAVNHASRTTKFSNFEEFQNMDSDAVICTSYISADKNATWLGNGFIFDISTGNEYVGMGHDMFSLGKNKQQVVAEYYRNKGLKALSGKGYKYSHRSFISSHLKDILHITENSYSDLITNKRKLNSELEKLAPNSSEAIAIQSQIAKIDTEIKRINDDYVARMDRVKSQISSNQINLEEIRSIDSELADAYEQFLARDNTGHKFGKEALMRNDYWNEVLVGNPTISAIYTKDISNIPEEYLIKAQEENLPIVIIK